MLCIFEQLWRSVSSCTVSSPCQPKLLPSALHEPRDVQGFVSNKDSEEEGKGDPLEALLYAVFVATSERASVAELAGILSVEAGKLQMAISIACRLGFGTRLSPAHQGCNDPTSLCLHTWCLDCHLTPSGQPAGVEWQVIETALLACQLG